MGEDVAANDANPYRFESTDEGVRMVKASATSSLMILGPPEDAELIKEAMADWLGREDFGE